MLSAHPQEDHNTLVKTLDRGGDGVDVASFQQAFSDELPPKFGDFDAVVSQFLQVASACRRKNKQREPRSSMSPPSNGDMHLHTNLTALFRCVTTMLSAYYRAFPHVQGCRSCCQ